MISKPSGQTLLLAAVVAGSCVLVGYLLIFHDPAAARSAADDSSRLTLADIPFNGARAYDYLNDLCVLGSRVSGSPGMQAQQKMLVAHFQKLGAKIRFQKFRLRHPVDGSPVAMANLIVEWQPQRRERILLCTHYDTRPYPDNDPVNPRGVFLGANDGASGTALLMELGNQMANIKGDVGVDFVFFDAEEFVFQERSDAYFAGSEYFAANYASHPAGFRYKYAVLLDMVGDAELQIYPDRQSMSWDDSRRLRCWHGVRIQGLGVRVGNHAGILAPRESVRKPAMVTLSPRCCQHPLGRRHCHCLESRLFDRTAKRYRDNRRPYTSRWERM
jgi:hypothetical protein